MTPENCWPADQWSIKTVRTGIHKHTKPLEQRCFSSRLSFSPHPNASSHHCILTFSFVCLDLICSALMQRALFFPGGIREMVTDRFKMGRRGRNVNEQKHVFNLCACSCGCLLRWILTCTKLETHLLSWLRKPSHADFVLLCEDNHFIVKKNKNNLKIC